MKKLALNIDLLSVQSFPTTPVHTNPRGTVRGYMDDDNGGAGGGEYTDVCSGIYSCADWNTCAGCVDAQRRIILY